MPYEERRDKFELFGLVKLVFPDRLGVDDGHPWFRERVHRFGSFDCLQEHVYGCVSIAVSYDVHPFLESLFDDAVDLFLCEGRRPSELLLLSF